MASTPLTPLFHSTLCCNFVSHRKSTPLTPLSINRNLSSCLAQPPSDLYLQRFLLPKFTVNGGSKLGFSRRLSSVVHSYDPRNESSGSPQQKGDGLDWPILKRWDVPWPWQTVSLTSLACGISFVATGLIETQALPYLGLQIGDLTLDEKAELLFVDQGITTAVVLGVLFSLTKSFQPLPDDLYRYDLREPFNLQKGWLLWAGIGLAGALGAIALTGVALSSFSD